MDKIIVIGGGILGASAAFHLSLEGKDITLIDAEHEGRATSAGAGIIGPWLSQRRNKSWYNMARGGARFYPELIDSLADFNETDTGYKRVGGIHLHDIEERLQHKYKHALKRKENAPEIGDISLLTESETKSMFPYLREGYRSVHITGSARVDGRALNKALLQAASKNGVKIIKGEASLIREGDTVTGAEADGIKYSADKTLITTGAWTKKLLEPSGFQCKVVPQKGQIIHFRIPDRNEDWPVVMPHNEFYLLNFGKGRVVFGATKEDDAGYNVSPTLAGQQQIINACLELAPGLKNAEIIETRVGLRPFTPGFLPVFGKVPQMKNVYLADGLGASGLTSGPFLGKELAKLALELETELNPEDYELHDTITSPF
ncbi:NAD(P)/FAD-dependent oxidoreductase [Alkalicoccus halolimnae]|uniref:FAD-dependent oxidoreductase n=1 Tax=Alkalicoccus halolimnae TaxID=1667239 RepID=A0A5C7FMJ0_9BACI|nr:FAD-dependent oxidoreductase [Alkalicoccus halolimnae]TXF87189.1 FAD-binding oxidoreductase [Alkalicoccus halolimnae]